jgi:hypothetical protein
VYVRDPRIGPSYTQKHSFVSPHPNDAYATNKPSWPPASAILTLDSEQVDRRALAPRARRGQSLLDVDTLSTRAKDHAAGVSKSALAWGCPVGGWG